MTAIRLSPATRRGMFSTMLAAELRAPFPGAPKKNKARAVAVIRYECHDCGEEWRDEEDAEECCVPATNTTADEPLLHCPVCDTEFPESTQHREVSDCCLWHDFDAWTRWGIADKVEAGATWAEAIAAAVAGKA
jgi:hypothetical protein